MPNLALDEGTPALAPRLNDRDEAAMESRQLPAPAKSWLGEQDPKEIGGEMEAGRQ